MQQKFAGAFGRRDFVAGLRVWLNVGVKEKGLAVLDPGKSIADVGFAGADGFDLAAFELNPRFVALEDMIIPKGFAVKDRFGSHARALRRGGNLGAVG